MIVDLRIWIEKSVFLTKPFNWRMTQDRLWRTDSDVLACWEAAVNYGLTTVVLCRTQQPSVHPSASVTPKYTGQQRQTCASVITSCMQSACIIYVVPWWNIYRRSCSTRLFAQVVAVACHAMLSVVKVSGTRRDAGNITTWRPGVGINSGAPW